MDGLSVAANIIAVLQAASAVISFCWDYQAALNENPWALSDVVDEITDLRAILEKLERLSRPSQNSTEAQASSLKPLALLCTPQRGPLATCLRELETLQSLLNASSATGKKRRAFVQAVGWRWNKDEIKRCLSRIERCKVTLNLALTADETALLHEIHAMSTSLENGLLSLNDSFTSFVASTESKENEVRRRQILNWMCPVDPVESHKAATASHAHSTGDWILKDRVFTHWESSSDATLWLTGSPGAGKTVLFSTLVTHLSEQQETSQPHLLAYFYCDFRREELRQPNNVIGSIVAQICTRTGIIPSELEAAFDNSITAGQKREPTLEMMHNLLAFFAKKYQVIILLDALDECENRSTVAKFLSECSKPGAGVKTLVASRDEMDIRDGLKSFSRIRLENHLEQMQSDVSLYINSRLESDARLSKLSLPVKTEIANTLQDKSAGMFRWVQCQLDSIAGLPTVRMIRTALQELPKGLDETYSAILRKVSPSNVEFVRRILLWLAFSVLPLGLEEVQEAIAIDPGADEMDEDNRLSDPTDILTLCGSLITMSDQGFLSLAHLSVRDYLTSAKIATEPDVAIFALSYETANSELATSCLTYINFGEFASGPCPSLEAYNARLEKYSLLPYAAVAWPYHVRRSSSSSDWRGPVMNLMSATNRSTFMSWVQVLNGDRLKKWNVYPKHATSLYYAASFGLLDITKLLIDGGVDLNARGSRFGGTALHAAVLRAHIPVMEVLLEAGADPNKADYHRIHPMHTAASWGNKAVIDMLLKYGASYDVRDEGDETPLDWARQSGQEYLPTLVAQSQKANLPESKSDPIASQSLPRAASDVWTRQSVYFPSFYEKRSGVHSSTVVSVELSSPPATKEPNSILEATSSPTAIRDKHEEKIDTGAGPTPT